MKNLEELDFDVRKSLAPRKSTENSEKPKTNPIFFLKFFFRRRKIEICKSSETRVAEVSWRSERRERGKRTFEVRGRLGGIREAYTILGFYTMIRSDDRPFIMRMVRIEPKWRLSEPPREQSAHALSNLESDFLFERLTLVRGGGGEGGARGR